MNLGINWKYLLLGILIIALISRLGYLPLIFEEPRRSEVSLEMMVNDNYIVPTINDVYYYNKPPLYNWMLVAVFKAFSTFDEWSVRLITVLSFLGLGSGTFLIAKRYSSREAAWLSLFFMLTTGDILYRFSLSGEIDIFYSLITFIQVVSVYYFYKSRNYFLLFAVSYVFCAAGFLTKGLTSPAFQVFTLLGWAVGFSELRRLFSIQHLAGILLFFGIVGGYFLAYSDYNDPLIFVSKLLSESAQRTESSGSLIHTIKSWAGFPFMLISVSLPWIILVSLINKKVIKKLWSNELTRFSLIFIMANILVYWISPGTRPRYLYPFLPFIMIIVAELAVDQDTSDRRWKILEYLFGSIILLFTIGFAIGPFINIPDEIPNKFFLGLVFTLLFGLIFILFYNFKTSRIWCVIGFLIVLRFAFNYIVLPVRKAEILEQQPYELMAQSIYEVTNGEKVWLYMPSEEESIKSSFFGVSFPDVIYSTITWPSYQISYYLGVLNGHVLSWDPSGEMGKYYLADEKYIIDQDIELLQTYYIPAKMEKFCLYKYNREGHKKEQ